MTHLHAKTQLSFVPWHPRTMSVLGDCICTMPLQAACLGWLCDLVEQAPCIAWDTGCLRSVHCAGDWYGRRFSTVTWLQPPRSNGSTLGFPTTALDQPSFVSGRGGCTFDLTGARRQACSSTGAGGRSAACSSSSQLCSVSDLPPCLLLPACLLQICRAAAPAVKHPQVELKTP